MDAWQQTWNLARACAASPTNVNYFALLGRDANGVRVPAMPVYIDPDHLANYLLLHYYTGDGTLLAEWQDSVPLESAPDGRRFLRLQLTGN